jgi:ABC-type uncharacterized transport system substrate-binding protein
MRRRQFLASVLTASLLPRLGVAQSPGKVPKVGWLTAQQAASLAPSLDALRAGLADYGYQEGRNLTIEYRFADDVVERVPQLADELVRIPVDLIVAQGTALFAIRYRNLPVPIVYAISADPVSAGFATSLARPRSKMTGLSLMAVEFNGKRLELLQEILPGLRRVAVIGNPSIPARISSAPSPRKRRSDWGSASRTRPPAAWTS